MGLTNIIAYRDFYDVPRAFFVRRAGKVLYFDCPFDDNVDDYSAAYHVYKMPDSTENDIDGSWLSLALQADELVTEVPVAAVKFDSSRRQQIETGCWIRSPRRLTGDRDDVE